MIKIKSISSNKLYLALIILIFCLGIFLRVKTYLYNISFWYDEAALALNIMDRSFLEFFRYLDYIQCAPPFFMIISKALTCVFGTKEWVFRLLPFLFGTVSMFVFYLLSKEILNKKWSILAANYLFAINFHLIYYCQEFKQYSLEVFITILTIYLFKKVDFKNLNTIKCLGFGVLFFILFLLSMTFPFILGAFIIYLIYKNKASSIKQVFFILLPFIFLSAPYYLFYLWSSKALMLREFSDMWHMGFIELNFKSIYAFFAEFFNFVFEPNNLSALVLVLCVYGAFLVFKDKKRLGAVSLLVFVAATAASVFHIYPIYIRLGLYLVPLIILFAVKPLDTCSFNTLRGKIYGTILALIFLICFSGYNARYLAKFLNPMVFHKSLSREMMQIIKNDLAEDDIVIYDGESLTTCFYYLRYFNIEHKNSMHISLLSVDNIDEFNNKNLWFYCTHRADIKKHVTLLKRLIHKSTGVKLLYEKEEAGSYIAKIKLR